MYFDYYYLVLIVPTIIFSLIAQILVKGSFSKYSKVKSSNGITGREAAAILLKANNIENVAIEPVAGNLTDHYDPSSHILRLSQPVYQNSSIAAIGVAAHETGHAIQHAQKYGPLGLRSALVPAANIGSSIGPWMAVIGLVVSLPILVDIGIILFSTAVLFYLVTLPVEFNASNRAIAILRNNSVLSEEELVGVKKVLTAASLTYVAAALSAVMNLLRLVLLRRSRD
jgi:Zn-dependent membrane protease YugP